MQKDLNRAFPTWRNKGEGQEELRRGREPEVEAVIGWVLGNPFLLSANLHDGAVVASFGYDDGGGSLDLPPDSRGVKVMAAN